MIVGKWRQALNRLERFGRDHECGDCAAVGQIGTRILAERGSATVIMQCGVCQASICEAIPVEVAVAARELGDPVYLASATVEHVPSASSDVH